MGDMFGGGLFGKKNGADGKNPVIMGGGSLPGGEYNSVNFIGGGTVDGSLKADKVSVAGRVSISGSLQAQVVEASGKLSVRDTAEVRNLKLSGYARIGGETVADNIEIAGFAEFDKEVKAEKFSSSGGFEIGESLCAEIIFCELNGKASAVEITGKHITVRRGDSDMSERGLAADTIEGEVIMLQDTHATLVRGNKITVGKGCRIGRIEYRESLAVEDSGVVGEQIKI
jgi:cytoskeletal protein CcmA (bactofilin family)